MRVAQPIPSASTTVTATTVVRSCRKRLSASRRSNRNEDSRAGFLEILRIGRKDLPARHFLSQHLDRSHVGEVSPQTLVALAGGEPHPVIRRLARFVVPEDEDNFVFHIDREAAEHGARPG